MWDTSIMSIFWQVMVVILFFGLCLTGVGFYIARKPVTDELGHEAKRLRSKPYRVMLETRRAKFH